MNVLAIVWSPRCIEQALSSHESTGLPTAFICGYSEIEGHRAAWELAHESSADVFLLSYDDQVVSREQADRVLELQRRTGDVVSGWQLPGQDSPFASAARLTWPARKPLEMTGECLYWADEVRSHPDELIPTAYFPYALTAVPRQAMLEVPLRVLSNWVPGDHIWLSRDGQPFDKGCCGDWCHAQDLIATGWCLWTARDVEVEHLAPRHGVPAHPFCTHLDDPGVYWRRRPRQRVVVAA